MTYERTARLGVTWVAALACALGAVGCSTSGGGDAKAVRTTLDRTTTTSRAALEAYCTTALGFATIDPPDVDVAAPDADQAAQRREYATTTLKPAADDLVDDAPPELQSDATLVATAVDELAATGAAEAYDNDTVDLARGRLHDFDVEHCELASEPVTLADFSFSAIDGVKAGPVSFDADNTGAEYHELAIVVKRPGVTKSFDEILALKDAAQQQRYATYVGGVQPVGPGEKGFTVVDLRAGEYLVACFLPVGSTPEPFERGDDIKGAPHVTRGMKTEFRVA
jgi:hypothetical protein